MSNSVNSSLHSTPHYAGTKASVSFGQEVSVSFSTDDAELDDPNHVQQHAPIQEMDGEEEDQSSSATSSPIFKTSSSSLSPPLGLRLGLGARGCPLSPADSVSSPSGLACGRVRRGRPVQVHRSRRGSDFTLTSQPSSNSHAHKQQQQPYDLQRQHLMPLPHLLRSSLQSLPSLSMQEGPGEVFEDVEDKEEHNLSPPPQLCQFLTSPDASYSLAAEDSEDSHGSVSQMMSSLSTSVSRGPKGETETMSPTRRRREQRRFHPARRNSVPNSPSRAVVGTNYRAKSSPSQQTLTQRLDHRLSVASPSPSSLLKSEEDPHSTQPPVILSPRAMTVHGDDDLFPVQQCSSPLLSYPELHFHQVQSEDDNTQRFHPQPRQDRQQWPMTHLIARRLGLRHREAGGRLTVAPGQTETVVSNSLVVGSNQESGQRRRSFTVRRNSSGRNLTTSSISPRTGGGGNTSASLGAWMGLVTPPHAHVSGGSVASNSNSGGVQQQQSKRARRYSVRSNIKPMSSSLSSENIKESNRHLSSSSSTGLSGILWSPHHEHQPAPHSSAFSSASVSSDSFSSAASSAALNSPPRHHMQTRHMTRQLFEQVT
eukprot:gb/GEZN01003804.1/.p1 GENE.gb/GEZN01003804.1/~~gb/GEZN01003804.1/.p1  ORF type:complete len:609 (+),score=87.22 gb/GEZN01003804.1/:44-1828(+)